MHGAEVVLHMGVHVRVRVVERRLCRPRRVWRKADERDVGDDRATTQSRRSAKELERSPVSGEFCSAYFGYISIL